MIPLIQEADRHISECKRRIDEQRRRIFELQKRGDDTTASTDLLATLIHFLAIAEMRRETLLRRSGRQDSEAA
jgi:hypothetical protein